MLDPAPPPRRLAPRPRRLRRLAVALGLVAVTSCAVLLAGTEPGGAHPTRGGVATPRNDGQHPWSTDGCSASPERGPGWDFHHACVHHDGCYRGRWASRGTCDAWFLRDMQASCAVLHRPGRGRDLCRFVAAAYHHAVRTFGAGAYRERSTFVRLR